MRIGTRLSVSFMALLALLLLIASVSLSQLQNLRSVTQNIVDIRMQLVTSSDKANQHALQAANYLLQLLQTEESKKRIPLYAEMNTKLAELELDVAEIDKLKTTMTTIGQLDMLISAKEEYIDAFRITVESIDLYGLNEASIHFREVTRQSLNTLLKKVSLLSLHQQNSMKLELNTLRQEASDARSLILILSGLALLFGAVLSFIITRNILKPLRKAVSVAESIAQGDLTLAIPKEAAGEMGNMLQSLRTMRDSIAQREGKILKLAYEDALTGLPNRARFLELLAGVSTGTSGMVAVLDINRFAMINNALGYAIGDQILLAVADRLEGSRLPPTLTARLWGDKFAFLLDSADAQISAKFARSLLAALQHPITLGGQKLDIEGTIGIALYPTDSGEASVLLRKAEAASKFAKLRHLEFAYSSDTPVQPAREQFSLIGEMRKAMERNEFIVYYQPKLHLKEGTVHSAEALLRWHHPERGFIPPSTFIPFAEQTGFIRGITPWIIEKIIQQSAEWQKLGMAIRPAVNLSALDLVNPGLVRHVSRLLTLYNLNPDGLGFEITESALIEEPALAVKTLNELSELGVKLSIDDFGSGQASLSYLKILPVHELKIDREFVTDVAESPKNAAIVRSTILLCHELGLTVVAEGAETNEEIEWLKDNRCDFVQGYVVAQPMSSDEFTKWVTEFGNRK
ncbi:MAG: EAL domain-containing protein [Gallionella sp.]